MATVLTRQQLHDLIWSSPMRDAAKQLGLSDVGLRKHCVRVFVLPPPQGHWNKVHAGQTVKILPLPPRPPGIPDTTVIGPENYKEQEQRLRAEELTPPVFEEPVEALRERVARNIGTVTMAKSLTTPHPALQGLLAEDARRRQARTSWDPPLLDSPLAQRRLRILQGLFHGVGRLDCVPSLQGKDGGAVFISVGYQQVRISFGLVAMSRQRRAQGQPDRLRLAILESSYGDSERLSWQDSEELGLEHHLSDIATAVVVAGEQQYREHLEWQYQARLKQREQIRQDEIRRSAEAERERQLRLEAARVQRLLDGAKDHRTAKDIRSFVDHVISLQDDGAIDERVRQWQTWALAQADRIDPISTGRVWDMVKDSE